MRPIRVVATYLMFLTFSINLVVLLAPALFTITDATTSKPETRGFWSKCDCVWYINLDEDTTDPFLVFAQNMWLHWMYIGAVSIMNICLFSWFILSFFGKRVHYVAMTVMGVFMLLAAGLVAATISMFAVKAHADLGVTLTGEKKFDWAMWLSIPGFAMATLTALVFIIQGPSLYRSLNQRRRK